MIKKSDDDGVIFKMNFLVAFYNVMCASDESGAAKLEILNYVNEDVEIEKLDWCTFVWDCLKETKKPKTYYCGSLTLLMLIYLHCTNCNEVKVLRTRPAILSWTTDMMRDREDFEIDNGGFGNLELLPINEQSFKDQSTEKDLEFVADKIEAQLLIMNDEKKKLNEFINSSIRMFPENGKIKELKEKFDVLFDKGERNDVDDFWENEINDSVFEKDFTNDEMNTGKSTSVCEKETRDENIQNENNKKDTEIPEVVKTQKVVQTRSSLRIRKGLQKTVTSDDGREKETRDEDNDPETVTNDDATEFLHRTVGSVDGAGGNSSMAGMMNTGKKKGRQAKSKDASTLGKSTSVCEKEIRDEDNDLESVTNDDATEFLQRTVGSVDDGGGNSSMAGMMNTGKKKGRQAKSKDASTLGKSSPVCEKETRDENIQNDNNKKDTKMPEVVKTQKVVRTRSSLRIEKGLPEYNKTVADNDEDDDEDNDPKNSYK